MLFKKKKKSTTEPLPAFVFSVPYSDHFKGYTRIRLDNYGDPEASKGLKAVRAAKTINHVTFEEYIFPGVSPLIRVFADGHKLGTIWITSKPEQYEKIKQGLCVKASIGFNDLDNVFLFVKFK